MRIISCEYCGVVIDLDRIPILPEADEAGESLPHMRWNGSELFPTFECPACESVIFLNGEISG